jgi:uncharacterized protein (TIGR02266 family)
LASTNQRQAPRTPVTLKIKFKSETLDQFIERYSVDISQGGIFIRTKDPLPVGTSLRFEFQLKDASPLITGDGTVVWTRDPEASSPGVAPGMGVRFDALPGNSQQILERILAQKAPKPSAAPSARGPGGEFGESPTRVAPDSVLKDLADDDPGGEFSESPTRVAPGAMLKDLASSETVREEDLPSLAPRSLSNLPLRPPTGKGIRRPEDDRTPLPEPMPFQTDADDFGEEAFEEATKVARYSDLDLAESPAKPAADEPPKGDGDGFDDEPTGDVDHDEIIAQAEAEARQSDAALERPGSEDSEQAASSWPVVDDASPSEEVAAKAPVLDEGQSDERASHPLGSEHDDERPARRSEKETQPPPPVGSEAAMERARELAMKDTPKRRGGKKLTGAVVLALALIGGFVGVQRLIGGDEPAAGAAGVDAAPARAQVEPDPQPRELDPTALLIETDPPGATVEIVGEDRHETAPARFEELDPDKQYALRVTLPGHQPVELSARPGEETRVALEPLPRVLAVRSQPPGASVTINGERVGSTPAEVELEGALAGADRYEVAVVQPGYEPATQTLDPELVFEVDGERMFHELRVRLAREAPGEPPRDRGVAPNRESRPTAEQPEPEDEAAGGAAAPDSEPREVEVLTPRRGGEPSGDEGEGA